jgi:hypothetical protein
MPRFHFAVTKLSGHYYMPGRYHVHPRCAEWLANPSDFDRVNTVIGSSECYFHEFKYRMPCDICQRVMYWPVLATEPMILPRGYGNGPEREDQQHPHLDYPPAEQPVCPPHPYPGAADYSRQGAQPGVWQSYVPPSPPPQAPVWHVPVVPANVRSVPPYGTPCAVQGPHVNPPPAYPLLFPGNEGSLVAAPPEAPPRRLFNCPGPASRDRRYPCGRCRQCQDDPDLAVRRGGRFTAVSPAPSASSRSRSQSRERSEASSRGPPMSCASPSASESEDAASVQSGSSGSDSEVSPAPSRSESPGPTPPSSPRSVASASTWTVPS